MYTKLLQARSQDFSWGGGAYLKKGEQIFNVVMIRYATVPKTHREECPTLGLTEMGTTFNGTENLCECRRRASKGVWEHPPRKCSNLKALKRHLQCSQADSCVKMVSKIDHYFLLNFGKKSVVISSIIFSYLIVIVAPLLLLAKYDTSYLRRGKEWTVYFDLLFIYASRVYS